MLPPMFQTTLQIECAVLTACQLYYKNVSFFVQSSSAFYIYKYLYKNLNLSMKRYIRIISRGVYYDLKITRTSRYYWSQHMIFFTILSLHILSENIVSISLNFGNKLVSKEGFPMSPTHIYRVSLMIQIARDLFLCVILFICVVSVSS